MKKKILLIEDETDQVLLMQKRFESAGYEFVYALTGPDGIKRAEETHPDLILLDLNLMGMNGLDVMKAIKGKSALKNTPIFIITARIDRNVEKECKRKGAVEIAFKPYDSKELLERIKGYLEK